MKKRRRFTDNLYLSGCMPGMPARQVEIYSDAAVTPTAGIRDEIGLAWIASTGHWGCVRHGYPASHTRMESVLVAELRAAAFAWGHVKPDGDVLLRVDSKDAVRWLNSWIRGSDRLPESYWNAWNLRKQEIASNHHEPDELMEASTLTKFAAALAAHPGRVRAKWVAGHHGHPLNEGADSLALMARRGDLSSEEMAAAVPRMVQFRLQDFESS